MPPSSRRSCSTRPRNASGGSSRTTSVLGPRADEIAARLHISRHTLRDHVKAIFAKVGAKSRSELTALVAGAPAPDLL